MENSHLTRTIDVFQIAREIWARRDVFFATIMVMFVLAAITLHFVPKRYTVSLSVVPVTQNSSQLGGGLGTLAKLGGLNVGDMGNGSQFRLFISGLTSRDVADKIAGDQNLMRRLFPEQWSQKDNNWKESQSLRHVIATFVKQAVGIPVEPWSPPSGEDVQNLLAERLEVDEDPKSPAVALRMQSAHPAVTLDLMRELVQVVDAQLRARALDRANDYIAYLRQQINQETVNEYKAALTEQLAMQEQTRMMASAHVSFAAQLFSRPAISKMPSAPKSIPLLILALLFGAGLGGLLAIWAFRHGSWQLAGWLRYEPKPADAASSL